MRTWCCPSGPFSLHSTVMLKIACERDDLSFMFVAPTDPVIIKEIEDQCRLFLSSAQENYSIIQVWLEYKQHDFIQSKLLRLISLAINSSYNHNFILLMKFNMILKPQLF